MDDFYCVAEYGQCALGGPVHWNMSLISLSFLSFASHFSLIPLSPASHFSLIPPICLTCLSLIHSSRMSLACISFLSQVVRCMYYDAHRWPFDYQTERPYCKYTHCNPAASCRSMRFLRSAEPGMALEHKLRRQTIQLARHCMPRPRP